MAVQYDKENGWSGFIVDIYKAKKGIVDLGDEFKKFQETASSKNWNFEYFYNAHSKEEIKQWVKDLNLSDESLKDFLKDWDGSGDIQEAFTARLQENAQGLTLFQRAGKAAGGVIKSLGATLASMAATWAIGEVISLAYSGIDHLVNRVKYAKEALDEFNDSTKEQQSNLSSQKDWIDKNGEQYEKLANGVDEYGHNISLTSDEFTEYKNLTKEIADMFPNMVKGYNDQNQAILKNKGSVDKLTESYQKNQDAYYANIRAKSEDTFDNFKTATKDDVKNKNILQDIISGKFQSYTTHSDLFGSSSKFKINGENVYDQLENLLDEETLDKLLKETKVDKLREEQKEFSFSDLTSELQQKIRDVYSNLNTTIDTESEKVRPILQAYLYGQSSGYNQLDDEAKNAVQAFIQNVDSSFFDKFDSDIDMESWITTNVINPLKDGINNDDLAVRIQTLFSLNEKDFNSYSDYVNAVLDIINALRNVKDKDGNNIYTEEQLNGFKENLGVGDVDSDGNVSGQKKIDNAKNIYKNISGADKYIDSLHEEELDVVLYKLEPDKAKSVEDMKKFVNNELNPSIEKETKKSNKSFDEVWSGLKESEQNKFTKLVNNGKLTAETFNKIGSSATALKETGLSVEDLCDKIRSLVGLEQKLTNLSNSMKKVGTAYKDYKKNGYVSSTSLNSMPDSFKNLEGYSKFSKIAGSKKSSKSDIQGAFNDIVTEYVSTSNILDDVTEKNKNKVITALRDAGIINAKKVVDTFLNSSDEQFSKLSSKFNKMSNSELQNFVKMLNQKGKVSGDFYKKIGVNNANMINGLSKQYKTDLVNWIKLCEKKRDAYNQLVKAVGGKNTKEAKKKYVKLVTKDESKLTAEDMGEYEAAQKGGIITGKDKKGNVIATTKYDSKQKKLEKKLGLKLAKVNFDVDYKPTSSSGNGSKSKSSKSSNSTVIDWIERKLDRLNTKLDLVKAKYDNLPSSSKSSVALLNAENKNLDDQIKILKKVQSVNNKSYSKYMKKAKKSATYTIGKGKKKKTYKLSKSLKKKIQNGRIKGSYKKLIATYGEPKANAIQKYQDYYDKAQSSKKNSQDAKKSITDTKIDKLTKAQSYYDTLNAMNQAYESTAKGMSKNNYVEEQIKATKQSYNYQIKIAKAQGDYNKAKQLEQEKEKAILDLQRQKIENIKTFYDNQVGLLDNDKQDIQNKIDLIEARGDIVSKGYYNNLTSEDNAIIAKREAELKDLKSQLSTTDQGTDNWYELQNDIQSVENEINDHKKSVYENTKAIGELNNKMYEAIYAVSSNLNAELDTIGSLKRGEISDSDTGTLTDTGLLQLYTAGLSYSATKGTAAEANARLAEIIKANKSGKVLEGYTSLQAQKDAEAQLAKDAQDQVTSVKGYGDKIIEIIKDAISSVKDHLQEIIDARKEALNEEKDLRDYERSILEKTKNVSSLQKQFMAVSGDTSEEGRLRAAQLRKSLDEAQQDLQDTEYDRYINDQQEMLDNMMNQFEDLMEKLQKDEDTLLRQGIKAINDQKGVMQQIFNKTADEYGYPTSTNLTELQTALTTGRITADIVNSAKNDSVTSVIKSEVEKIVTAYNGSKGVTGGNKPAGDKPNGGDDGTKNNNSSKGQQTQTTNGQTTTKPNVASELDKKNATKAEKEAIDKGNKIRAALNKIKGAGYEVFWTDKKGTPKSITNQRISAEPNYDRVYKNAKGKTVRVPQILTEKGLKWLASKLGIKRKELNSYVESSAFATGGIAKLVKPQGEDGIAWLRNGEGLVAPENVQDIRDLMDVTPDLTKLVASFSNLPNVKQLDRNVTKNVSIDHITFDMPNVTNATDFTDTIKKPEQQKAFAAAIGDAFNGKKLNINRY